MAKNWALVIGINKYNPNNFSQLNYAKRDAELVRDFLLSKAKFDEVCYFSDDSPNLILPNRAIIPTLPTFGNLLSFLQDRFERPFLSTGDNCWFFFAGHGVQHANRDYLMPMDANLTAVEQTAIPVNYVRERLCRSGADNVVLIMDACRSEGSRSHSGIGNEPQQGIITIYACSPTQKSWEIDALQQGVFTYVLLEALQIVGEHNCATVERLDQYLHYRVPEICRQYGKHPEQNPRISADPATKLHFILMPQYATLMDISTLKNDAYQSEVNDDLELAEQIWIRLLATSFGRDMEVIKAVQRIAQLKITHSNKTNNSVITTELSRSNSPSDADVPLQIKEMISSTIFLEQSSRNTELVQEVEEDNLQGGQASGEIAPVDRQLGSLEEVPATITEVTQNFAENQKNSHLTSSEQTQSRPRRRQTWPIVGIIGTSAIAVAISLGWWWQNQHTSVSSDIPEISTQSLPDSRPIQKQPNIDLETAATGIVTATARENLSQGDLQAGLAAVEELLNRGALAAAETALKLVPTKQADDASVKFYKGRLAWQSIQTGDNNYSVDDARRDWETAAKAEPESLLYNNALGFAYYTEGNLNRANDSWFKALNLALKEQNTGSTSTKTMMPQDALTSYAGLALGLYKSALSQSSGKQTQYLNEAIKLRQIVLKSDQENFQADKLAKNWLWTEKAIEDWRSLLQEKGEEQ